MLRSSARQFREALRVGRSGSLLDIGCGAGATLYAMDHLPRDVVGVDFSAPSLELAAQALPSATFLEAEAAALPFPDDRFDAALSCGVALYFPDLTYARAALAEMVRVLRPGGRGLLIDLMDVAYRDQREARRRASLPPGEYDRLYADLPHLYLDPSWVHETLGELGCQTWAVDAFGPDYGYAEEAFHVVFQAGGAAPRRRLHGGHHLPARVGGTAVAH